MKNCHFYNSDKYGVLNSVSGRNKDGSCSVTINNYNCKFPADVYADFAKKNITVKTYMLKNTGKNNKENAQIDEIIRSLTSMTDPYCSINPRFYPERQGVKYHKLGDAECEVRINQYGNSYSCQGSNTNYAMEEIKRMYEKQKDFSERRVRYGRI